MPFSKKHYLLIAIIASISSLSITACKQDDADNNANSTRNDVIIGLTLEPDHLDPTAGAAGAIDDITYHNIFEGLTRINEHAQIVPMLATRWDISDDGKIYTFHLKENVRFHNGEIFDADDVLFSLNRARGADSVNAQKNLFENIASIEKTDDSTIAITLDKKDAMFAYKMAWGDAVMVDATSAHDNKNHPIGTGAFKFIQWQKGQSIQLNRNDNYHDTLPPLQQITFKFFADNIAAFNAVASNVVDGFPNFQAAEQLSRLDAQKHLKIILGSTEGETILAINHGNPILADKNMRLAIAHALDKKAIIDGAMFGYATPIFSHIPPHHPYHLDLAHVTPFDVEKAKSYLAQSNYQGEILRLDLPPPGYARRSGEIIAAQLRTIGINVKLQHVQWAGWLKNVFNQKDYDLTIIAHTEPSDINIYARPDYYFSYQNENFNQIWTEIQNNTQTEILRELYGKAQQILAEDAVNGFLFQLPKLGVWHKDLQGYWQHSPVQAIDATQISWQ